MSFLSRLINSSDSNNSQDPVTLQINDSTFTIPGTDATGLTIREAFQRYATGVDASRINQFVVNGERKDGSTLVEPGQSIRGAIATESKG
jgi:hypothetical protein